MKTHLLSRKISEVWYDNIKWVLIDLNKISFSEKINKEIIKLLDVVNNIINFLWEEDKNNISFKKIKWQKWICDISINCKSIDIILKYTSNEELKNRIIKLRSNYIPNNSQKSINDKNNKSITKDARSKYIPHTIKKDINNEIENWNSKDRNEKIDILLDLVNKNKDLADYKIIFNNISFKWLSSEYDEKYWIISNYLNSN